MKGDGRSLRVAVVGDGIVNPAAGSPAEALLAGLVDQGWGLIQLPPAPLGDEHADAWRAHALDQVDELRRHGLAVVVVLGARDGRERDALAAAGLDVGDEPADADVAGTLAGLGRIAAS
jgi:hypothetical protein